MLSVRFQVMDFATHGKAGAGSSVDTQRHHSWLIWFVGRMSMGRVEERTVTSLSGAARAAGWSCFCMMKRY